MKSRTRVVPIAALALAAAVPLLLSGCTPPAAEEPAGPSVLDSISSTYSGERQGAGAGIVVGGTVGLGLSSFLLNPIEPGQSAVSDLLIAVEEDPEHPVDPDAPIRSDAVIVSGTFTCEAGTALTPSQSALEVYTGEPGDLSTVTPVNLGDLCAGGSEPVDLVSGSGPGIGATIPVTFRLPATLPDGSVSEPVTPEEFPEGLAILVEARAGNAAKQ